MYDFFIAVDGVRCREGQIPAITQDTPITLDTYTVIGAVFGEGQGTSLQLVPDDGGASIEVVIPVKEVHIRALYSEATTFMALLEMKRTKCAIKE